MSKLRLRWLPLLRHRWSRAVLLSGAGSLVILAAFVFGVLCFGWSWTGFARGVSQVTVKGAAQDTVYLPAKTLWDWMQLLLVPVMLAVGGFWLNRLQRRREERVTAQRDATDRAIAKDNQQEVALQAYIDKIGELLLREHGHLGESPGNPQVENIARARTITVLQVLDPRRRASLLQFLSQAGILWICTEGDLAGIDLHETNLFRVDLGKLDLRDANLSGTILGMDGLRGTNLFGANLSEASLMNTDLRGLSLVKANLSGADLMCAKLSGANLLMANLSRANLTVANLSGANLTNANLSEANLWADLSGVNLTRANLTNADLTGANLSGANLSGTDLRGASLTNADLRGVKGLTDVQRAEYQSRGAIVDPLPVIPSSPNMPVSPIAAPVSQSSEGQDQMPPSSV
jgi:uncharacterized protein YjbI with pentapeptide repeats